MSKLKEWSATCPKCSTTYNWKMFKCRNCGKGKILISEHDSYNASRSIYFLCNVCDEHSVFTGYDEGFKDGLSSPRCCPKCRAKVADKFFITSGCFIATAVYGDYDSTEVKMLRAFRDNHMQNSMVGRAIVQIYYKISPPIADKLVKYPFIAGVVRNLINLFLKIIAPVNKL